MEIVCIGLMVYDVIIKPVEKSMFDIDTVRLETLKTTSGGDALNAAINMAKLGIKVGLIGKVGNDPFGEYLINRARKYGVITDGVKVAQEHTTSTSIVMVENSAERHFAYYGKTNDSLCIHDIDMDLLAKARFVHVGSCMSLKGLEYSGIAELFKKAGSLCKTTSMDVTWDVEGKWLEKIEDALYHTDIFMPSYDEAKAITGLEELEQMKDFFKKYGIKVLVVKLGSEGCYVTDFRNEYRIKTFNNVPVVDTTGAGDAFVSGFLTGMSKGWNIYSCGLFGNAVASNCVMEFGATDGVKTLKETIEFINENIEVASPLNLDWEKGNV